MRKPLIIVLALLAFPSISRSDASHFEQITQNLGAAEKAGQWKEAIALEQEIIAKYRREDYISSEGRLAETGDLHMNLLEFDAASKIFEDLVKTKKDRYGEAALGLAQISVEKGDFKQALNYLTGYASAFGSGCGNCLEARNQCAHIYRTLWQYAQLPPDQARQKLERVAAGNFQPLPGNLTRPEDYKKLAARQAKFLLAGMLRRENKIQKANTLYHDLASGNDEAARLSKAYLAKLP